MKFKNDKYKSARGASTLYEIHCRKCDTLVCHYQKDGPGALRRMYADRIMIEAVGDGDLICGQCQELLGIKTIYQKEQRPAYRLFTDSVTKKKVSIRTLS